METMIPITSSTTLSIAKTAKLLQNLVDLKEERNLEKLPDLVEVGIRKLLKQQQEFVKIIDDYMHLEDRGVDEVEIETLSTILEVCPEFLATMDEDECLPCHRAVQYSLPGYSKPPSTSKSTLTYFPLFADIGRQHGVGGKEGRGGLRVKPTCCPSMHDKRYSALRAE